jgi:predicted aldo/keto reductase-like oxidoreductase
MTSLRSRDGRFSLPVCRLGLSSRGNTNLTSEDVHFALDRGVTFLNWCGTRDNGMCRAIGELGARRKDVVICAQFEARTAADAEAELGDMLKILRTDYLDVLTLYYVEELQEWQQIAGPGGALEHCGAARRDGRVRLLGVTSHQRPLAASFAETGLLDVLMIRYNAAHRGAERDVFPVTDRLAIPVIAYTAMRWGALLQPTPDDPPGFVVPRAPEWYRFVLQSPSVAVVLMAPDSRAELEEDLSVLERPEPLPPEEYERLAEHGRRVRKYGGAFP